MSPPPDEPGARIRPMRAADVEPVLDRWQELMANGQAADPRYVPSPGGRAPMRDYVRDRWLETQPFVHAWVAEDGGPGNRIVGFVDGFPVRPIGVIEQAPTAMIGDLWVSPSHRRRGLGRALVTTFLDAARAAGWPRAEVGTLAHDAQAVAFWRSMGFADWKVVLLRE